VDLRKIRRFPFLVGELLARGEVSDGAPEAGKRMGMVFLCGCQARKLI
jgi:hypothetical protein